jgi:hypothetical protein
MRMLRNIKNYFISAIFIVAVPFCALLTSSLVGATGYATDITISGLNISTNQERANAGLAPLSLDSRLSAAAYDKANDMIADNYWAHYSPDGASPWTFISASGYDYSSAGENLAKDFTTSSGVIAGWMASPAHKVNLLKSTYVDVGYAIVNGTLLGSDTTIIVAMYGTPPAPAPTPAPVVESSPTEVTSQQVDSKPTTDQPEIVSEAKPIVAPTVSESLSVSSEQIAPLTASEPVVSVEQTALLGQVEGATSFVSGGSASVMTDGLASLGREFWKIITVLGIIMLFFAARSALSSQRDKGGYLRI